MSTPSRGNPVLGAMSVSAGIDAVVAIGGFTNMVPATVAFWIVAGNLFLKVALGFYVRGQVVPAENVVTRIDGEGNLVAGKGNISKNGEPDVH